MRNLTMLLFLTCSIALTALAARPTSYPSVSLKVTVNTNQQYSQPAGTATDVSSDGAGPYIDGQAGVCASLNTTGDLIVDFDCASASTSRRLGFNLATFLAHPTGGASACNPPLTISPSNSPAYTNHLGTAKATDRPAAAFQAMTADPTGATVYYIQIFIATKFSDTSQTAYRLNYHGTTWSTFPDAALASYAEVRRLSATEWVVEPVAPSALTGVPPNAAMLVWETSTKHSSTTIECGFYQVPFSFTLDQK